MRAYRRLMPVLFACAGLPHGGAGGAAPGSARVAGLDQLLLYRGEWAVTAERPWSGAKPGAVDRLTSACTRFAAYVACEQSVNGKPLALIVYTAGERAGTFHTRTIAPNGLAGGRGTMTMAGARWTYLDKPAAGLTGPWSMVENVIVSRDRIEFVEYESSDEGKNWSRTNSGVEIRTRTGSLTRGWGNSPNDQPPLVVATTRDLSSAASNGLVRTFMP